ncbi:hypothetical protein BC833DRAFT_590213 [Globomyces pollinis-pini]|nr:hypothetical protein BC833DRAFT_590213 [Globomyces pollinis-pini]
MYQINLKKPTKPLIFLQQYFHKISEGDHILGREYEHIVATTWNRTCLINKLNNIIHNEKYRISDIHQLAELICPDIPVQLFIQVGYLAMYKSTQKVYDLTLDSKDILHETIDLGIFGPTFKAYFINKDFFENLLRYMTSLDQDSMQVSATIVHTIQSIQSTALECLSEQIIIQMVQNTSQKIGLLETEHSLKISLFYLDIACKMIDVIRST